MTWGPDWLGWALIGVVAFCSWRSWASMGTAVDAILGDDERQRPTHRMMLVSLRRGTAWAGASTFSVGVFLIGSSSCMGPLAVGATMMVFPGFWSPAVVKVWLPRTDHKEPIGPEDSHFRRHPQPVVQLEKPAGPPTLSEWLDE